MPRAPDNILEGVAFLYKTKDEAEKHARSGGTCFLIGKPIYSNGKFTERYNPFMVTNRHVAWDMGCPVIRVNRRDGLKPDVIDLDTHDWIVHPDGDDLAIASLIGKMDFGIHALRMMPTHKILTKEQMIEYEIGVGDEVLMPGRFLNHQGSRDNRPAMRFGCVSMMLENIPHPGLKRNQESFAVEMRSRTGFSGSPVAVYRQDHSPIVVMKVMSFFGLLGVNWGHIIDPDTGENTWLNGVVPSWKILELLEVPALSNPHKEVERDFEKMLILKDGVELAGHIEEVDQTTSQHKEAFTSLLNAAARTKPQAD